MLAREILNWTEEKMDDIDVEKDKHPYLKAFGLGAVEGYIDGAMIAYPILLVGSFIVGRKLKKLG